MLRRSCVCLVVMLIAVGGIEGAERITFESKEILAQATCSGRQQGKGELFGWMYAVRRDCDGAPTLTCNEICQDGTLRIQDHQLIDNNVRGHCVSAMFVYDRYYTTTFNQLGLKILSYGCGYTHCGPNYCCCEFTA